MFNASQLQRLDVQPFSCLRGNSFLVSDKSLLQLLQASRFVGVLTITSTTTQRYSVLLLLSQRLHTSLNHKRVDTTNQPAATDVVWLCQHLYTTYVPSPKQQNTTRPKVETMVEEQNHVKHSTSSTLSYTGDKSNIFIQSSCTWRSTLVETWEELFGRFRLSKQICGLVSTNYFVERNNHCCIHIYTSSCVRSWYRNSHNQTEACTK